MMPSAACASTVRFPPSRSTGKERDSESGNDYFTMRYYASAMGRWMSPDPLGGNVANPQSFNRYEYVFNNPLRFTDSTGLSADCGGGGEPSAVCMVTSAWDWLKSHLGGGGGGGGGCTGTCSASNPNPFPFESVTHHFNFHPPPFFSLPVVHAQEADPDPKAEEQDDAESEPGLEPLAPGEFVGRYPGTFYPGEEGPLDPRHAKNFTWYIPVKLQIPETYYRQWGPPAGQFGRYGGTYYSFFPPESSEDFMREQMSLPREWNSMENIDARTIPSGSTVFIGPASAQAGYQGNGIQVFVPDF